MGSSVWKAKPDHPDVIWAVFVREKVAGKRKHEPVFKYVLVSPLAAILAESKKHAELLHVPVRKIEVVAYTAKSARKEK